jgi:hypothetical protein
MRLDRHQASELFRDLRLVQPFALDPLGGGMMCPRSERHPERLSKTSLQRASTSCAATGIAVTGANADGLIAMKISSGLSAELDEILPTVRAQRRAGDQARFQTRGTPRSAIRVRPDGQSDLWKDRFQTSFGTACTISVLM